MEEKKKYRIAMAVTNDLVTDRRVDRHCRTLTEAGYEVVLIGRELPDSPSVERPYPTLRMTLRHRRSWRFYAEYNWRLAAMLRSMDINAVWANDLDTLPGCWLTARRKRCPLVLDCHELFPEVPEIRHKPVVKAVWQLVERLIPNCNGLLTVCNSLADYYHTKYGVEMTVVRNLPEAPEAPEVLEAPVHRKPPILLYQGAVNVGRGVDWAIDALEWLPDCRLVVAGGGDLLEEMKAYAASKPWTDRITFTGRLEPEKLEALTTALGIRSSSSRSPKAVGLVMLEDLCLSYHYALPNRIGDFVQAGIPMVVSNLPEMARVVKEYGIGEIMKAPGAQALAESVKKVLAHPWSEADFAEARKDMNWSKEKEKLLETLKQSNNNAIKQ